MTTKIYIFVYHEASKHSDEGGLSCSVLSKHHHDLRVVERPGLDVERERPQRLGHRRIVVVSVLGIVLGVLVLNVLRHFESQFFAAETQVLCGDETYIYNRHRR